MVGIKGMEIPNDCMGCMFCNHLKSNDYGTYGDCAILGDGKRINLLLHQKHSDCPLVEIITCKYCRHWKFDENKSILCGYCNNLETETNEDFYCSDAEMRE